MHTNSVNSAPEQPSKAATPILVREPEHRLSHEARLAVFSALVFPVALVPFLLLRRSLHGMHHKLDQTRVAVNGLQRELKSTLFEMSVRRDEHARLNGSIMELRQAISGIRDELKKEQSTQRSLSGDIESRLQRLTSSVDQLQ
jgi:septal ring factor EnvC (AmiA/AmiB activator)